MHTSLNNSTRSCDLTHENLNSETEITKTTGSDFCATSMPISADVENIAEADSDAVDLKNVPSVNPNGTNMSTTNSMNNNGKSYNKNGASNNDNPLSIRINKQFISEIRELLYQSCRIDLSEGQICILAIAFSATHSFLFNEDCLEKIPAKANSLQDKKVCFRIPTNLQNKMPKIFYSKNFTFTRAVHCCLIAFKHHILESKALSQHITEDLFPYSEKLLESNEYLFSRFGVKKNELLDMITLSIEELRKKFKCTTYIEAFTGTANVLLHLITRFDHEEINDGEEDIVNLLKVIQNYIDDFIRELLSCSADAKTFYKFKEELKDEHDNNSGKKSSIRNAVKFFYTILLSFYGKGGSLRNSVSDNTLLKKIIIILIISKRLHKTKITKNDVFYFLKKIEKQEGSLKGIIIYLDPPYIGTENYYKVYGLSDNAFHKRLRKQILKLRERGAIIVLSYRATVRNGNKFTTSAKVQEKLDELYMNKGFFIQFLKVQNEQIEILLTSEQVSGSVPYDCNIADLIKKYVK